MYRFLLPVDLWQKLLGHFEEAGRRETGAFFLFRLGRGAADTRLLAHQLLFPPVNGWDLQQYDQLRPGSQWLSVALGAAIESDSGLGFIHSHPGAHHPPSLSRIDHETSLIWSRSFAPITGKPFVSLVWSPHGVAGIVAEPAAPTTATTVERVEVQGNGMLRGLHMPTVQSPDSLLDDRQERALSVLGNARIRELHIGVVGAGGTGSPVAEQLARMGVQRLTLIDPDVLDTPSNLRRIVGSMPADLQSRAPKAAIVARHLRSLGLGGTVAAIQSDVRAAPAAQLLLDADLAITTTDTHGSRAFVNQLAHQYWLPTIDVGVRVGTKTSGEVSGMPVELRILLQDSACLWCRSVLSADRIREENLPSGERERLAAEGYVQGVEGPVPSLAPLNYHGAALAVLTALRLYSGQPVPGTNVIADGWEQYAQVSTPAVREGCLCGRWRGQADNVPLAFLPV